MSEVREFLRLQSEAGAWTIGQIRVAPGITLRHVDDGPGAAAETFTRAEEARELAKYDDGGKYRPLKTAPNLRRGWTLQLSDLDALHLALDLFYPAALGTWLALGRGRLTPVPLRGVLARQSGMYRVTQLIRDDQAAALIAGTCDAGCLRRRLWRIADVDPAPGRASPLVDSVPVLCVEACNLLVAACRPPAKENLPKTA